MNPLPWIVIGSTAAKHHLPEWRQPKDLDVFTPATKSPEGYDRFEPFWDERLRAWFGNDARHASLDELYTIKQSHAVWALRNGSWDKHMADMLRLEDIGAILIPELYDILVAVWDDRYGPKRVDLTQESDEFFADAVKRVYDHDSLHRSVAYTPGRPIYEKCLKDGKSVQMDMGKVWAMPTYRILRMFREEIYVTALERWIVPNDYQYSPGLAYQQAVKKTITSLTKGRSAEFLVDHYRELRKPDINYVEHHLTNNHFLEKL